MATEYEKARMRAYYRANKEKILAANRKWREEHPEQCKAYIEARKNMDAEHRLRRSEANRRYYAKNKEKMAEYRKAWLAKHPNYYKEWRAKNKDMSSKETKYLVNKIKRLAT